MLLSCQLFAITVHLLNMHTFLHPIQGSKCVILVVIFSHGRHAILSVRLSRGLSSVTEDKPCFPSDYPGGYLQSLKTCHVILQIILGVMFSHREHDMLSVRLSWGLSSVTKDMPCYPLHFAGDDLLSLMMYQFPSELTSILSPKKESSFVTDDIPS